MTVVDVENAVDVKITVVVGATAVAVVVTVGTAVMPMQEQALTNLAALEQAEA